MRRKSTVVMLVLALLTASFLMTVKPTQSSTDLAENSWATKASTPFEGKCEAAVVNGKIYVIQNYGSIAPTYEYDPETDTWTLKSPMPTPRANFHLEVVHNKIYCIGGAGGVNEVYDPASDTWETLAPLPNPRDSFLTIVFRNRIVIGGMRGRASLGITEVYDPTTDTWEKKASLPNSGFPEAGVVIKRKNLRYKGPWKNLHTWLSYS